METGNLEDANGMPFWQADHSMGPGNGGIFVAFEAFQAKAVEIS